MSDTLKQRAADLAARANDQYDDLPVYVRMQPAARATFDLLTDTLELVAEMAAKLEGGHHAA